MKVEAGMWVRLANNYPKIYPTTIEQWNSQKSIDDMLEVHPELILKASHNIVDVLEIGDVARYQYISSHDREWFTLSCNTELSIEVVGDLEKSLDVSNLSVMTKEQFESYATNVRIVE